MKILFCGRSFPAARALLQNLLPEDDISNCPGDRVMALGPEADVIIPLMHRLEPELIARTAAQLIQQWGVGLEGVDVAAATARGIAVCNVPGDATANAQSTAEHAVFLMMGVARRIHECCRALREGPWGSPLGESLTGASALIVGLGRVGKALARKLSALGMQVEAVRRTPDPETEKALGLVCARGMAHLHEMAARADFVISTIALADGTRGIFNRRLFEAMKPSAFVINISRGGVIEETDLLEALRAGRIAGAGLDVFRNEPLEPESPLLALPNVFATPHVAGVTRQNYDGVAKIVAGNVLRVKNGETPLYCVNRTAITPKSAGK